jgi:hypothetical protein
MAFNLRNLSVLAYANGFTFWHYKAAADDHAAMNAPSYFSEAGDMLSAGDVVLVTTLHAGRMLCIAPDTRGQRAVPLH